MKKINLDKILDALEYKYICRAMKAVKGNRTYAARLLGLKRTTLVQRIRLFDLRTRKW